MIATTHHKNLKPKGEGGTRSAPSNKPKGRWWTKKGLLGGEKLTGRRTEERRGGGHPFQTK